ncbi:phosphatidylglycerophosphate synthase [Campylobacter concisus]|uniref:helix-turn-helix domain-containing protein n=1 Tax=Campylobacter concisus TaxID=199 RepID=UPI0011E7767E|nr:phosphatidylglycerophosphate synthase [Campylobacter concisus]MBE9869196.1 phosphatidylglycerophosphate synthase [Campylobacter concisus]
MNELENLKEIGIKEISRKTHIEPTFLQYIFDKNFEKLSRLNIRGYAKILQREYGVDLSELLAEYDAFMQENTPDDSHKTKVSPKIASYTPDDITNQRQGSGSGFFFWIIILAIITGGAYYFDAYKYVQNFIASLNEDNTSVSYSQSSIVNEVKKNIIDTNVTISQNTPKIDANASSVKISAPDEQNVTVSPASVDQNALKPSMAAQPAPKVEQNVTKPLNEAIITPKQRVWIGIINLENGQKTSSDTSKSVNINLDQRQLVVCGNGNIELKIGDKVTKYNPSRPARFLVENGDMKFLTYDEFVEMNKGKSW